MPEARETTPAPGDVAVRDDGAVDVGPLMAASRVITAAVVRSLGAVDESLTVPQLRVLVMLSTHGRLNLSGVAARLGVNPSNASRTCDSLVRRSLVDRRADAHDRRHISLALSRRGRRFVDDVMEHRQQLLEAVVYAMPPDRQRQLMGALEAFNAAASTDQRAGDHEDSLLLWLT